MNILESFISGSPSFSLFVRMARSLDLLMDLVPSWAYKAFDTSVLFIQRKLHVTHVGVRSAGVMSRTRRLLSCIFPLSRFSILSAL